LEWTLLGGHLTTFVNQAILGAHGYKTHEHYSPVWTLVQVPEIFLSLICPMAEGIVTSIEGTVNVSYWLHASLIRNGSLARPSKSERCDKVLADGNQAPAVSIPGQLS
jgi:hypothetical protein